MPSKPLLQKIVHVQPWCSNPIKLLTLRTTRLSVSTSQRYKLPRNTTCSSHLPGGSQLPEAAVGSVSSSGNMGMTALRPCCGEPHIPWKRPIQLGHSLPGLAAVRQQRDVKGCSPLRTSLLSPRYGLIFQKLCNKVRDSDNKAYRFVCRLKKRLSECPRSFF